MKRLCPGEIFKYSFLRQVLVLVSMMLLTEVKLDAAAEMDTHCALDRMGLVLQICPLGVRVSLLFLWLG